MDSKDARRACEGCPPRRVGMSLLQTTGVNVLYELANLARGQVTAHISPASWWENMQQGMVWDLDNFTVNQIGHPYQGNNYFNSGRANGLSFYESAALTAFGLILAGALTRRMLPLRWFAVGSGTGLLLYGLFAPSPTTAIAAAILLPVNIYRAIEVARPRSYADGGHDRYRESGAQDEDSRHDRPRLARA